jgi:hypothetical protein
MTTLSAVIASGALSAIPVAGIAGRIYFATDTKHTFRDNGATWDDVTSSAILGSVALAPGAGGNFTVAHGLPAAPSHVAFQKTSGGDFWFQTPTAFDATNLYLVASDADVTGVAICFA